MPRHGTGEVARRLPRARQFVHRLRVAVRQTRALLLEPAVELWRRIRDVEAFEQRTPIEVDRLGGPSGVERGLKRDRVAPQRLPIDPQLFVGTAHDRRGAERAPEEVDRLAEGIAGVLLVLLRPEESEQLVTTV